jgi:sortase (surface protein transpeptidase)
VSPCHIRERRKGLNPGADGRKSSTTALPGWGGNVGLAGHCDTFFRLPRDIRENDDVLFPTTEESVALATCFPFHYVGAAPQRLAVRAVLAGSENGKDRTVQALATNMSCGADSSASERVVIVPQTLHGAPRS